MGGQGAAGAGLHGPFHRLESPTQTKQVGDRQVATGAIWGTVARWGYAPTVKAYRGPLPDGVRGIEFTTLVAPRKNAHPTLVEWRQGDPGVRDESGGYVSIPVTVTRYTQV